MTARWKEGISFESQLQCGIEEPREGKVGTCPLCREHGEYKCQGKVKGYQWEGELYGPNYPIMDGGEIVGFYSPPHKTPTGKRLQYSDFRHPLATDHWDKAMMTARKGDLARAYENHLKGKT